MKIVAVSYPRWLTIEEGEGPSKTKNAVLQQGRRAGQLANSFPEPNKRSNEQRQETSFEGHPNLRETPILVDELK